MRRNSRIILMLLCIAVGFALPLCADNAYVYKTEVLRRNIRTLRQTTRLLDIDKIAGSGYVETGVGGSGYVEIGGGGSGSGYVETGRGGGVSGYVETGGGGGGYVEIGGSGGGYVETGGGGGVYVETGGSGGGYVETGGSGGGYVEISFDEMSHEVRQYSYTVYHLNADFSRDGLNTNEYLRGFTRADITDYEHSFNTQQLYTHYRFTFPNEDIIPTITGNYAVVIYEDGNEETPVATVCLSIYKQAAQIRFDVRSNTNIELNGRYQQLDVDVSLAGIRHISPDEFTLVVEQNDRLDNKICGVRPNYIESNRLRWKDCRQLIFEGGQEYQHFDISSVYFKGNNVDQIYYDHTFYHAFLFPSELRSDAPYLSELDGNGSFVINVERTDYDDTEADYMFVHFILPCPTPFFDGSIYLLGSAWQNSFTQENRMTYDNEHKAYVLSYYLKQGGYEWLYAFVPKNTSSATLQRTEGSHWQTNNTYRAYLYHRPFGGRYDELIGVAEN